MDPEAVTQAFRKYQRAEVALEEMKAATEPSSLEMSWIDFLMASSAVYTKLEQGAKVGGSKSLSWFAARKGIRKTDPLLKYLHQARNAEEHGIRRITGRASSKITIAPGVLVKVESDGENWIIKSGLEGVTIADNVVTLIPVYDGRSRSWYHPPSSHLGDSLPDKLPLTVALRGL